MPSTNVPLSECTVADHTASVSACSFFSDVEFIYCNRLQIIEIITKAGHPGRICSDEIDIFLQGTC